MKGTRLDALCGACLAGPRGDKGHDDLLAQSAGSRDAFRCGGCGTFWARFAASYGGRAWVLVTEPVAPAFGSAPTPDAPAPILR